MCSSCAKTPGAEKTIPLFEAINKAKSQLHAIQIHLQRRLQEDQEELKKTEDLSDIMLN
jgi:hypothetical protein